MGQGSALPGPLQLHDGQSSHARHAQIARRANVSQPRIVASSGKSAASSARLALNEGRIAIVTNVERGMRWTQGAERNSCADERRLADGEVVWSWPPDAEAKLADVDPLMTGARKPGPRGEREGKR
jgi:hypothetical protein